MLILLKGAHHPFQAAFRTVAYAQGVGHLWMAVPCIDYLVGVVLSCALMILGHSKVQESTEVKVALAIFLPIVATCLLCIGGPILFFVTLAGMGR